MKIRRSKSWYWLLLVAAIALVVTACSPASPGGESELTPITFTAGYLPQGNISFVAAYVAQEKGYFEEEGLDVTIEHAAPGTGEQWTRLAGKGIHFTTDPGESFVKRVSTTEGTPFRMVSVLGQEGDHALMVLEDSGIAEISDLVGLTVGYKGTGEPPWLLAMLNAEGLALDDVNIVQVGFDPRVLLPEFGQGRVDALQVFKSNEPNLIANQGYPVHVFNPEDFGVHFLGQGYVTHVEFIEEEPEMVQSFVNATLRGLEYALNPDNKEEVTDIIMQYAGDDADRAHNEFIWQTEIQFVQGPGTEEVGLGYASQEQWEEMINVMVDFGSLEEPIPVDGVWAPQFVEAYHENN